MSDRVTRLSPSANSVFYGHQIDRQQPIKFRLNGVELDAFSGDTILSSVIASGMLCAGTYNGFELALDETLSMPVSLANANGPLDTAFPMERTPAIDGADFVTANRPVPLGILGWANRLVRQPRRSLNADFSRSCPVPGPWIDQPSSEQLSVDLLVIGGGIAGLAAAAHAAKTGETVLLVERRPYCGGNGVLFGHLANEKTPEATIADLKSELDVAPNVTVFTRSDVLEINGGTAKIQRVQVIDGRPHSLIFQISAKKTIIATGTGDQLPFFSGNRHPGVMGLGSAFHLGSAYGIWLGGATAITTNNNAAYRLALLANDGGATVEKLMDSRLVPQSRFAEFAKAYGIRSESGLKPAAISTDPDSQRLNLQIEYAWEGGTGQIEPMQVDGVVVSGGWLPRLSLWQQAGGQLSTDGGTFSLAPVGEVKGVALAGFCAGWQSTSAVVQSGIQAVQHLFGRKPTRVVDQHIDPAFETPDGILPVTVPHSAEVPPAFFDGGISLASQAGKHTPGILDRIVRSGSSSVASEGFTDRALSLGDLNAKLAQKQLPCAAFEAVCRERAVAPTTLRSTTQTQEPLHCTKDNAGNGVPSYLAGRFGKQASLWIISPSEREQFEVGYLIYANSDTSNPMNALGVIVAQIEGGNTAVLSQALGEPGRQILVLGSRGHSAATVLEEFTSLVKN